MQLADADVEPGEQCDAGDHEQPEEQAVDHPCQLLPLVGPSFTVV